MGSSSCTHASNATWGYSHQTITMKGQHVTRSVPIYLNVWAGTSLNIQPQDDEYPWRSGWKPFISCAAPRAFSVLSSCILNILKDAPDIKSIQSRTEWIFVDSEAGLDVCSCCGSERGPIQGVSLGPSLLFLSWIGQDSCRSNLRGGVGLV